MSEGNGDGEETPKKHRGLKEPWKPGQSGNPAGRPKGSRGKLGEAFLEAMHADFIEHGKGVIETVRLEKPDQYLKVVASILPKQMDLNVNVLDGVSDDELEAVLVAARAAIELHREGGSREGEAGVAEPADGLQTLQ